MQVKKARFRYKCPWMLYSMHIIANKKPCNAETTSSDYSSIHLSSFALNAVFMKSVIALTPHGTARDFFNLITPGQALQCFALTILLCLLPFLAVAQTRDLVPIVECVKYTGNGKFQATFGYDNPNKKEVSVAQSNSYLTSSGTKPNGNPVSSFKTGRQSNVFTVEFDGDKVTWSINQPNGKIVFVETSLSGSPCQSASNILPSYNAPSTGKTSSRIGPELAGIAANPGSATIDLFQYQDDHVLVELYAFANSANTLLNDARTLGLRNEQISATNPLLITGWFPITNITALASLESLHFAQPVFTPNLQVGATTSQGDTAQGSHLARLGFKVQGTGVKVGVLSDSYNAKKTTSVDPAALDISRADLPASIEVLKDMAAGKGTDEGRAMMQIVHDVAPGAALAFRSGFFGAADLAQGILDLQAAGCQVIVDDITYITEPFMQDGQVAQAVNRVSLAETDPAKKVAYFSAAGNFGQKSYYNTFKSAAAPSGISGFAHDFGGGDRLQRIALAPGAYTIVLQWDDLFTSLGQTGGTRADLDLYLADDTGRILYGFNRDNLGKDPVEIMPFFVTGEGAITNLMIINATNGNPVALKYIIFRGDLSVLEYASNSSTLVGQANAEGAIAVGAVLFSNTPAYDNTPSIASFSSRGGTPILRTTAGSSQNIVRNKPEISAPNGVNTTVNLGGANIDGDAFFNFFGTSAAAPHAAGLAALLIEAQQKYNSSVLSPTDLKSKLQTTALDMGPAGFDYASGWGFVQATASLATITQPTPVVLSHRVITGPTSEVALGAGPYTLAIEGDFFTNLSVVYFNGNPLATSYQSTNELIATLPRVEGNYPLQIYSPAAAAGAEGIYSDPYYFLSNPTITITAQDTTKVYGDALPQFEATISGIPLGMTAEALGLGLNKLVFSATTAGGQPVTALTDAGDALFPIKVAHADGLTGANGYTFQFEEGNLNISKASLSVQVKDMTVEYGASLTDLDYEYILDISNDDPAIKSSILHAITTEHRNSLNATALINAVALINDTEMVNGVPLINGIPLEDALANRSFMLSAAALINATALINSETKVVTVNGTPLVNALSNPTVLNAAPLINGVALINAAAIANGTALINNSTGSTSYSFNTVDLNGTPLINAIALINSTSGTNNNSGTIAIVTETDAVNGTLVFNAIPLVTGLGIGQQYIAPGALLMDKNFNVSYKLAKLTITPKTLTVVADDQYMNQGATLPLLTAQVSGFAYGENMESLGTQVSFNADELIASSAMPGTYPIKPSLSLANYVLAATNGTLFVNPTGSNVKSVKPILECIELHPTKAKWFIAHYGYQNDNNVALYVPVGPDNQIKEKESGQTIAVTGQITAFYPGTHSRQFSMEWDGVARIWELSTGGNSRTTAVSSEASASSSRCPISTSASRTAGQMAVDAEAPGITELAVYPNPVTDQLLVDLSAYQEMAVTLTLTDMLGRMHINQKKAGDTREVKLEMNGFKPGVYLLKIEGKGLNTLVRIIKQ